MSQEDLKELDSLTDVSIKDINKYVTRKISQTATKYIKEREAIQEIDLAEAKKLIKDRYPYNERSHEIKVECRSKKVITGKSFEEILSNPAILEESPINAEIIYRYADVRLDVKILSGTWRHDEIKISISPDKAFAQIIAQRFREWAEAKQRVELWRRYSTAAKFVGFMCFVYCLVFSVNGLFSTVSERSAVIDQARQIMKDGVSSTEVPSAIEAILKLQLDDFNTTVIFDIKLWYKILWLSAVSFFGLGMLCPKSVIGIGKGKRVLNRYLTILRYIRLIIGTWIVAIVASMFGTLLYEYLQDKLFQ